LLVNGVVAGVGAVIVFLPQILLLFLFIGFLEDTGYMARAAFLMDRLMSKMGLHGKSFIPDAEFIRLRHSRASWPRVRLKRARTGW
jgi:Fe2+ transport system protein B